MGRSKWSFSVIISSVKTVKRVASIWIFVSWSCNMQLLHATINPAWGYVEEEWNHSGTTANSDVGIIKTTVKFWMKKVPTLWWYSPNILAHTDHTVVPMWGSKYWTCVISPICSNIVFQYVPNIATLFAQCQILPNIVFSTSSLQ